MFPQYTPTFKFRVKMLKNALGTFDNRWPNCIGSLIVYIPNAFFAFCVSVKGMELCQKQKSIINNLLVNLLVYHKIR